MNTTTSTSTTVLNASIPICFSWAIRGVSSYHHSPSRFELYLIAQVILHSIIMLDYYSSSARQRASGGNEPSSCPGLLKTSVILSPGLSKLVGWTDYQKHLAVFSDSSWVPFMILSTLYSRHFKKKAHFEARTITLYWS